MLLEAGQRILPLLPPELSARAKRDLEDLGVDVRLGTAVTEVDDDGVTLATGERILAHTVFWGAGNQASPLAKLLGAQLDRAGRVQVEADLSVPGFDHVFAIGDIAAVIMPGVSGSRGRHRRRTRWARTPPGILADLSGTARAPFTYFNKGDLATIGRYRAVAAVGSLKMQGVVAWLAWLFVHILYLAGFRNRITVFVQWAYQYFTYQRGVRLITGTTAHRLLKTSRERERERASAAHRTHGGLSSRRRRHAR